MIKVLLVDDSALVRSMLKEVLTDDSRFEVVSEAGDGQEAVDKARAHKPDLIIMDINMPVMNGIQATKQIMSFSEPTIIMFTTEDTMDSVYKCITAGAIDVFQKPRIAEMNNEVLQRFIDKIYTITKSSNVQARDQNQETENNMDMPHVTYTVFSQPDIRPEQPEPVRIKHAQSVNISEQETKLPERSTSENKSSEKNIRENKIPEKDIPANEMPSKPMHFSVLLIGSSTGGPTAVQTVLNGLSEDFPLPIILTQHIDEQFDIQLARWLNDTTHFTVELAQNGTVPQKGHVYVAPAKKQLILVPGSSDAKFELALNNDPPMHFLKPSVDKLFLSAADILQDKILAVVLSGMGKDGAQGCAKIIGQGGFSIVQNQETCVVFGMPKAVIEEKAAKMVLPLKKIAPTINDIVMRSTIC